MSNNKSNPQKTTCSKNSTCSTKKTTYDIKNPEKSEPAKENLFGTDGIRKKFDTFPLTQEGITKLGLAIGVWANEKYGKQVNVLIGHDTRISCEQIKHTLASGIVANTSKNFHVSINDAQVIPTPAIVKIINESNAIANSCNKECSSQNNICSNNNIFNFGIIITASHNQYHDNGIKIVDSKTGKLSKLDEDKITEIFYKPETHEKYLILEQSLNKIENKEKFFKFTANLNNKENNTKDLEPKTDSHSNYWQYKIFTKTQNNTQHNAQNNAQEEYIKIITSYFDKNLLKGKTVALDCANGAAYKVAPEIFRQLGAEVIEFATIPDGKNINKDCGSVHPESIAKVILEHNSNTSHKNKIDIGFAFDGDSDRIAAINSIGKPLDGDDILYIISKHPKYIDQKYIVGTIMTNFGLELDLKSRNKELLRTKVGDKYVVKEITDKNLILGGEQSGHIVVNDYLSCSDGIFAALKTIESIQANNNWELKSFSRTPQKTINIPVKYKHDLSAPKFKEIIDKYEAALQGSKSLDKEICNYSKDNNILSGRIIVRYSGTENLLRIMVECNDKTEAEKICSKLAAELGQELNK